jgi:hypothetical protein
MIRVEFDTTILERNLARMERDVREGIVPEAEALAWKIIRNRQDFPIPGDNLSEPFVEVKNIGVGRHQQILFGFTWYIICFEWTFNRLLPEMMHDIVRITKKLGTLQ